MRSWDPEDAEELVAGTRLYRAAVALDRGAGLGQAVHGSATQALRVDCPQASSHSRTVTVFRRSSIDGNATCRSSAGSCRRIACSSSRRPTPAPVRARPEASGASGGRPREPLPAGRTDTTRASVGRADARGTDARHQRLELRDQVAVPSQLELCVDQILPRGQAELLEPPGRGRRERLVDKIGQRRPAP